MIAANVQKPNWLPLTECKGGKVREQRHRIHRAGSIFNQWSLNRTPGQAQRSQPLILGLGRILPLGCSTLLQRFREAGLRLTKKKPRPAFAVFAADVRLCPYGSPENLFVCLDVCLNERGELLTTSGGEAIQLVGLGHGQPSGLSKSPYPWLREKVMQA
jgi:hypothetical protein